MAALSEAQKAVFAEPASSELRQNAAALALQEGYSGSALALLTRPSTSVQEASEVSKSLGLRAVAECVSGQGGVEDALKLVQKAVRLNPGDTQTWRILAYVRSNV